MKYGVNLYPENAARRAARIASVRRGARLGVIASLGLILIAAQIVSGSLLRERAGRLERRLSTRPDPVVPSLATAGTPAGPNEAERDRVVWFPKVAAIARDIPDEVFVTEIVGVAHEGGRPLKQLDITAHITGDTPELAPALELAEALRRDRDIAGDFPEVEIRTARGTRLVTVSITCRGAGPEHGR